MDPSGMPWRALEAPEAEPTPAPGASSPGAGPGPGPGSGSGALPPVVGRLLELARGRLRLVAGGGVLALVLAAAVAAALLGAGRPHEVALASGSGPQSPGTTLTSAPAASGKLIVVHVTGAVARPGIYRLPVDARVADAITAAGGYAPGVDPIAVSARLNLAEPLRDGQQVRVPSRDDPTPSPATAGSVSGAGGGSGTTTSGPIDLNSATAAQLDTLPGIGPVTAGKIVASRDEKPFTSVRDLLTRKLVSQSTFDKLAALITVH